MEASHNNWRLAFIILGVVGLLFAVGWFVVVRDTPEQHPWVSPAEREEVVPHRAGGAPHPERARDAPPVRRYLREPLVWSTGLANLAAAVLLMSGVLFFMYFTAAQYFAIVADLVPAVRYGGVVGFVHFVSNCAGIAAPFIVGWIVNRTHSWPLTFGVAAGICAGGAVQAWRG